MIVSTNNFYNKNAQKIETMDDILNMLFGIKTKQEGTRFITFENDDIDADVKTYARNRIKDKLQLLNLMYERMKEHNDFSYNEYKIPKKKGGYREISEPNPSLKELQKQLYITLLQCHIFPNDKAYAYIDSRGTIDMAEYHKDSRFVVKMDLKNFFPSITKELLKTVLLRNYAFVIIEQEIPRFLDRLCEIACYKGSLPQGSPLSPYLSNILMVEFDHRILKHLQSKGIKYTRYADDMVFSSKKYCSIKFLTLLVQSTLKEVFGDAIKLNKEKTKQLKTTGRCYVVGVKINNQNNITYGHEKKKKLKYQLYNMFKAYEADKDTVPVEQIQELIGQFSYMKQIEPNYANYLERKLLKQFNSSSKTLAKHFKY